MSEQTLLVTLQIILTILHLSQWVWMILQRKLLKQNTRITRRIQEEVRVLSDNKDSQTDNDTVD